ncbi:MAG: hypothetical protein U5L03_13910 [Burkholderiaceae bacterium]|nr:hypothetical protein [Burkholderiaceae bacterium]
MTAWPNPGVPPRRHRTRLRRASSGRRRPPLAPHRAGRASPPAVARLTDAQRTALLFGVAFVAAALLYWPAFEAKTNLPDALYGAPLAVAAATALVDAAFSRRPFTRSLWVGAAVLPAAVFARVVYDGLRDPTSHNLWPFEIAIAIGVGLPAALAGAALGWLVLRVTGRGGADAG